MRDMILSILISALLVIVSGKLILPMLTRLKFGQSEREEGPKSHLIKAGTPTMGGLMMIVGVLASTLILGSDSLVFALPSVLVFVACAIIGFVDDFVKIKITKKGLRAYQKIIAQFLVGIVVAIYCYKTLGSTIELPFSNAELDLGWFYIPFALIVVIAAVNSVNLIDGLDGLSSGVTLIYSVAMGVIFIYLTQIKDSLGLVMESEGMRGMVIFCGAIAGACLGFLRYNSYPAKVFMGDTGSLALGGAVAMMALCSRAVLLLPIMGGCYVATAVSVILQVGSFKLMGKRIFKMAPLHHHFELMKIKETKIVSGYMIVTALLCLISLLAYT